MPGTAGTPPGDTDRQAQVDIRKPDIAEAVGQALQGKAPASAPSSQGQRSESLEIFQGGVQLLRQGHARAAVEAWLRAAEGDPASFLVRKQIWHLLYPEHFEPEVGLRLAAGPGGAGGTPGDP